jgi:hypothetical protein
MIRVVARARVAQTVSSSFRMNISRRYQCARNTTYPPFWQGLSKSRATAAAVVAMPRIGATIAEHYGEDQH